MRHRYALPTTSRFLSIHMAWIVLGLLNGCSPVLPWERGILAKEIMSLEPSPLQSTLRTHQYGSREAASGGGDANGGGCGCY